LIASSPAFCQSRSEIWQADEEAELGDVADVALDHRPSGIGIGEAVPGVLADLLHAEADAALLGIDLQDHHLDLLAGRNDLTRMDVLLGPAHLGDMDQTFNPRLQLHEGAVVGDVGDATLEGRGDRIFRLGAVPGIGLQLLHA
jgi:hypothetical protein